MEEDLYLKIYEYSDAVIHLESSHTRIPAQTTSDREMTQLLHRCVLQIKAGCLTAIIIAPLALLQ